jgi:maltose alpha-D-glucosyltransferase/alpha-amylase
MNIDLGRFLADQRWFGAKARRIHAAEVRDSSTVRANPEFELLVIEVRYAEGAPDTYFVPLAGDRDALDADSAALALLALIESEGEIRTQAGGVIRASRTSAFDELRGAGQLAVQRCRAEQSNTSLIFGDRLILKIFRRLEPGPNPDFEIGRYLTDQTAFEHIPQLAGGIEYFPPATQPSTLGMLQQLVPNRGDGWATTLQELDRYYDRLPSEPDVASAALLGRRTGDMHLALAAPPGNPAFSPEPVTPEYFGALAAGFREHAARVLNQAPALGTLRSKILDRFGSLEALAPQVARIRVHGDYHLGQVLATSDDFVIIDFEGEPLRPLAERRSKQLALKDVAGMLRSFSYAAAVAAERRGGNLASAAALWEQHASAAFLDAYRETVAGATFIPLQNDAFSALLDAFLIDKAVYELHYELNHRPAWVRIPLRGILSLAGAPDDQILIT